LKKNIYKEKEEINKLGLPAIFGGFSAPETCKKPPTSEGLS